MPLASLSQWPKPEAAAPLTTAIPELVPRRVAPTSIIATARLRYSYWQEFYWASETRTDEAV
jgi:hypothetical protein